MSQNQSQAIERVSAGIEQTIRECGIHALRGQPAFIQAVNMARGIRALRELLTDKFVEETFMPLQGTPLGFLTDRDNAKDGPRQYTVAVVRDVLIEAFLRGFQPVGNEFNIIAGRFYGAKAGFERIVTEFPGLTDLKLDIGVPVNTDKGFALVPMEASWFLHGVQDTLSCRYTKDGETVTDTRIPVRVNAGMGPDAVLGKATRKMYARVYQRLTGCSREVIDGDVDEVPPVSLPAPAGPAQDGKRISMRGKKATHDPSAGEVPPEQEPPPNGSSATEEILARHRAQQAETETREPGEEG